MNPNRKRLLMSIINGITIFSMILTMTIPVANFTNSVNAQESTETPTVEAEAPTETATDVPAAPTETSEAPTETEVTVEPTAEMTAIVTDEPTAEATSVVTEEATTLPTTTPTLLFQDDFQDGDTVGWTLTPGWQLISEPDNIFLSAGTPNETATIAAIAPADFALSARVRAAWGNKAAIAFRAGAENYTLTLDLAGNVATVNRGVTLLGSLPLIPPPAGEDGTVPLVWYAIGITAAGNTITVTVDGQPVASFVDPSPLPAGAITFSTDAANTGSVAIDDVIINAVDPVTAIPTAAPTAEITPEITETPAPTEAATPEATPEPEGMVILSADFESELIGWTLGEGASVVTEGETNHALLLAANDNLLPTEPIFLSDFRLDARVNIVSDAQDGNQSGISIPFRTQDGRTYVLSVEAGQTTLSRNNGEGLTPLASSPTAHALNTWHTLTLDATGGHLTVTINGVVEIDITEAEPLLSGQIAFIANTASSVLLDDIMVTDFSGMALMSATPEPMGLSDEEKAKLPAGLLDVMDLLVAGDAAGAQALAQANYVPMDEEGRIRLVVWATENETGETLGQIIQTVGGAADYVYDTHVNARVPLAGVVALANTPQIAMIDLASLATSTGLAGAPAAGVAAAPPGIVGEGFDIISANDWHTADPATQKPAVLGAGQSIGLIDVGFAGAVAGGEYGCLASANPGGSSTHGAKVLQILCDVAPGAAVRLYRAIDAATLATAINSASAANNAILITMDLGVDQGPGDGVGAGSPSEGVYSAIETALANDLVIASAGNNNNWVANFAIDPFPTSKIIGRYFSMAYTLGAAEISIPVMLKPQDIIRVGWNDWDHTLNDDASPSRENFDIRLEFTEPASIKSIRAAIDVLPPTADPGEASLPITAGECVPAPATLGYCAATLFIGGPTGGADPGSFGDAGTVFFQVQISGQGVMNRTDISGATLHDLAGNLARPADSPNALAVGAVCARPGLNYPLLRESSSGPIFTTGGDLEAGNPPTPLTLKPALVGPADVSIFGSVVNDVSDVGCQDGDTNGFSGTSAAAAYVAAEAALIRSNLNTHINPAGQTLVQQRDRAINYLLSHTIDLFGAQADGFDQVYGAGMPVLGNPAPESPIFNPLPSPVPTPTPALGDPACPSILYVGHPNPKGITSFGMGSATNPYVHPADALVDAGNNACVILLPGEYVTGIYAEAGINTGIRFRSYDSANSGPDSPSVFWSNSDLDQGGGAGFVIDGVSVSVEGFAFRFGNPLDSPTDGISFERPYAFKIISAPGSTIRGNSFTGIRGGGTTVATSPVIVNDSNNVVIEQNLFTNNDADNGAAIRVILSGTGGPIRIERNFFKDNLFSKRTLTIVIQEPVIKIEDSVVRVYNNRFNGNATDTIILVNDVSNIDATFSGSQEVQVFGNAFTSNFNDGPIVHLNPGRRFRFINNTVAHNELIDNAGPLSAIILRGTESGGSGQDGDGLIDVHNNIFYDNTSESLVKDNGGGDFCNSINGGSDNGARNNWSFNSNTTEDVCQIPFANPLLNNNVGRTLPDGTPSEGSHDPLDPLTNPDSEFVGPSIAPDDPYQQKAVAFGIDNADESLITVFNGALIGGVDALGKERKNGTVDLGAYEFKPVTAGPTGTIARAEDFIDTSIIPTPTKPVIQIPLYASGGFGSYTFEVVSLPQNYSTDLTNTCGGRPVFNDPGAIAIDLGTGVFQGTALYCPPRHFYNVGIPDALAAVTFQYRVRDAAGNFSPADTVTVTLSPTADKALTTTLPPYSAIGVLTDPPSGIDIRLRPYARFGNFRLAAPGNSALLPPDSPFPPDGLEAQYPYTYNTIGFPDGATHCGDDYNPTLFGANLGASQGHLSTQFGLATSSGIMTVTPQTGQVGCFPISYNADDAPPGGGSSGNILRLVVVGSLPDKGIHDDTSFSFDYHGAAETDVGSWTPIYNETSINNTLHQSTGLNDTAEFLFDAIGFALYMQGSSLGGAWELKVENAGVPVTMNWAAVPGVIGQLQSTAGGLLCRTTAPLAPGQIGPVFNLLTNLNAANQPYVVSCSGFLDDEANKVQIINKAAGKQLKVDAIGILAEVEPLQPGFHEVTEAQLLPTFAFAQGWTPVTDIGAVGQKAVYTSSIHGDFSFRFQGTGFALGTALQRTALVVPLGQPTGAVYKVCVADTAAPTDKVCQRFDNSVGATTLPTWKVFRPFFGFDPSNTYDVFVDIISIPNATSITPMKFYIDSIVVYNTQPTAALGIGTTEDDVLGPIVFGGGLDDTWLFNSNLATASNKSLTSIITTVPKVGPFISFQIPESADTLIWTQVSPTVNTTDALICVDRPQFGVAPTEYGNCIVMNTRTGAYQQVTNTGTVGPDPSPVTISANPLTISEGMFRTNWPTGGPHTVEISSLSNLAFNLDKIQVIDTDGPLMAGYYEENARNIRWFIEPGTPDAYELRPIGDFGHFTEVVTTITLASGGKLRQLNADSVPGGTNDNLNLNEGMFFQFNGTGFSVFFRFDTKADAARICWRNDGGTPAAPTSGLIATVLASTCQTYDNQSAAIRYKAARTIAGLTASNYSVVVQMLNDQGEPANHIATALPINMAIDAVQIYNNPLPPNILNTVGTRYETSFVNQAVDGRFAYLGTGWKSVTGTLANLYSGQNYDSIVGVIGAGVVFRTSGAVNVVIYRDTRLGFAPMEVCVVREAPAARRCTIIQNNGGTGYQQPIVVPLFDATAHRVSIVTTDFGTFNLDAIAIANTPLLPGIYDENNPALVYSNTSTPGRPVYSHWKDITSTLYEGGGAMQSQLAAGATPGASVSFQFTGTGFSLITQFDSFSGSAAVANLEADIVGTAGNDYLNIPLNSFNAAAVYKSSHSVTGLPQDTYTVTITENGTTPTKRRFTVDGVEIYGFTGDPSGYDPARRLAPGLYDNAATNTNSDLYLSYGPSNAVWTAKSGALAATYMNQTNHSASRYGAEVTFEVLNANAITLFHTGSTSTAVQVCAVRLGTTTRNCTTQTLVGKSNTTFTFPGTPGTHYVSITNLKHGLLLYVDAIGVFATGPGTALGEGIYQENNPGLAFTGTSWLAGSVADTLATDKFVKSTGTGNADDQMEFTFNGTGFSIILVESTATSESYSLCVKQGTTGGCPGDPLIVNASGGGALTPVNATAAKRPVALTYVGLAANTYTVTLVNRSTTKPLLVDRVDVLGALPGSKQIGNTITGNVENTDPRITFFPFFTYNPVANVAASNGSQHTGSIQGSVAYFEIDDTTDFDYVRQTAAAYGTVQVCSAAIGTESSNTTPACSATEIETVLNTGPAPVGYQKAEPVDIGGSNLRWVILRNTDGKVMLVDYIRPFVPGNPLTAGYYEETHDELLPQYIGPGWTPVTAPAASGGATRATTNVNDALLFEFTGTGFSTYFTLDPKADAVRICWRNGSGDLSFTQGGQCTTYDNQSAAIRYKAARTILGLAPASYTASVQMLADNNLPAPHVVTTTPITMQIDAVQVYNDALPDTVLDDDTKRYETSYVNRAVDDTFLYYGTGWTSFSGAVYKLYSGSNYDRITGVIGAGVVFRTNGANAIVLYRQTAAGYTPLEVCATRVADGNRVCTTVANNGSAGYQQPIGIPLNGTGEQRVSIVTLDAGSFALDAIQVSDTTAPLQPGLYQDTHPGLSFTNNAGTTSGAWATVFSTLYNGGTARQTTFSDPATGDILTFSFTNATGFEINMGIDRYGGEAQVCYDDDPLFGSASCYTYQNEQAVASNLVTRSATGLNPATVYHVRVRHAEDGQTVIPPVGPRLALYATSRLRIDYVNIFGAALPPVVTQGGIYNENASAGGVPYLQLLPAERWGSFSGTVAAAFSDRSYAAVVTNTKVAATTYAGPVATLRVNVPASGATVILYTGAAITTNTDQLLVCAGAVNDSPPAPAGNCTVITNLKTTNQIVLNEDVLNALGNPGTVTLSFRALKPGLFRIDGFQVIQGSTLAAGIYDDFLFGPTSALATGGTGTWTLAPATASKLATAYGGTQALGQGTGATLTFDFAGSGFGVVTTLDAAGVDMRLCYKLASNGADFPLPTVLNQDSQFDSTDPGTEPDGITCRTHTTDTSTLLTDWSAKNGNIPRPAIGYQFGIDVHGLANNTYTAEIMLVRPAVAVPPTLPVALAATDRLKIDAIVVFSDITTGTLLTSAPNGQLYDNTNAGIRYEPGAFWTSTTTLTGPITGPWNRTEHSSAKAGAVVQFEMNGNGFILYQTASLGSRYVRICVRTHLGQECSEFNQYSGRANFFAPIAFYGFGTGLDHEVVIENRDHGRLLSIDGLKIIP